MNDTELNNNGPAQCDWTIQQTPAGGIDTALHLVVGAGKKGPEINSGVAALRGYLQDEMPGKHRLWWANSPNGPLAAALAVHSPGNTAVVLFSTTQNGFVQPEPLTEVLEKMSDTVITEGETLIQGILDSHAREDIKTFEKAGFKLLAELIFMRSSLRGSGTNAQLPDSNEITLLHYDKDTDKLFRDAIISSYEDSLDCPALEGIRKIEDVLAGHKAAGIFRPDLWTVAIIDNQVAGVLLLNQNAMHNSAEVIYMGVSKAFRGRHLGRLLLQKARQMAKADKFSTLTLAVDAENHYAHKLYLDEGFTETMRRLAYVKLSDKSLL